jgi:invasion protein IalB
MTCAQGLTGPMQNAALTFRAVSPRWLSRAKLCAANSGRAVALAAALIVGSATAALAQQPAAPGAAGDTPEFIYSPWVKFCGKGQDAGANQIQVCFTGRDSRTPTGQPVAAAALIEADGEQKKILRVTVPNPVQLQYGSRIFIDQNTPQVSKFWICYQTGCLADYDVPPDMIAKMKSGQNLVIQVINLAGQEVSYSFPLAEFKKANEGPASDPNAMSEQQNKLRDELQKRADDERKRLEAGK